MFAGLNGLAGSFCDGIDAVGFLTIEDEKKEKRGRRRRGKSFRVLPRMIRRRSRFDMRTPVLIARSRLVSSRRFRTYSD